MAPLIAEELLLIAYRRDGAAGVGRTELDLALGGALLVELALAGNVEPTGRTVVAVGQRPPPSDPRLAEALADIAARPRSPKSQVRRLAKGTRARLLAGLVAEGVLTELPRRMLRARRYPLADPRPRQEIERRLRAAVFDGGQPDERTAALAGLVRAGRLERRVFPDDDRRELRRRLAEISEGDWAAEAVRKAIRAAQAATAAAVSGAASTSGG
ncbi:MAG TPA: GPP34 family phosphoprotein [Pseudonocardia sp.]|jgi:hypothetical protein|uniref:GOLPH3/VPS74 family protein n=1 Tax=Pseudonocardia sp. TaxID=60912 RepID=UPI002F400CD0